MNFKKLMPCLFYCVIPVMVNANQPAAGQAFSGHEQVAICFILPNQKVLRLPVLVPTQASTQELMKIVAKKADSLNLFKRNRVSSDDINITYDRAMQLPIDNTRTIEWVKKPQSLLWCALKK